jgi:hypothetical protein
MQSISLRESRLPLLVSTAISSRFQMRDPHLFDGGQVLIVAQHESVIDGVFKLTDLSGEVVAHGQFRDRLRHRRNRLAHDPPAGQQRPRSRRSAV